MSILRTLERRGLERRGADGRLPWGDSTPVSNGMLGGAVAGTRVDEKTALQVTAVYGCVGLLAESVSSLPVDLMSSPHRRTGRMLEPSPLIVDPYTEISVTDWWVQYTISLALRGNFYGQIIERDRNLYATQIKPIHPDHARVRRLPDGSIEYRFNGKVVPRDNVFHVKLLSISEGLEGLNPIEYLRNILGLARAADLYGAGVFQNSAIPAGTLEVPADIDLDSDEAKEMKEQWLQLQQGIGRAGLPAVLTGGTKFNPITMKLEDLQFLQSRQYDASVISGQIFRIPPHMIGIVDRTTSWGTGIEQQQIGYVRDTLMGYLIRGERALTALHPPGQFVKFDLSERLRGDRLQRYTAYNLGRLGGWLNADEIRAEEDMPPLPNGEGQEYLVPINSELLSVATKLAQQAIDQANQPPPQEPAPNGNGNGGGSEAARAALLSLGGHANG